MIIHNKEYTMFGSVEAICTICDLCPDGKLERLTDIYEYPLPKMLDIVSKIIVALLNAGEKKKKYEIEGYKPHFIDEEEILSLGQDEILKLQTEMFGAIKKDSATSIETKESKTSKKEEADL